jgi:hypothetical protein
MPELVLRWFYNTFPVTMAVCLKISLFRSVFFLCICFLHNLKLAIENLKPVVSNVEPSFNDLIRLCQHVGRNCKADLFGGL